VSELRSYRGTTRRQPAIHTAGPIAPWHANVKIVPLELARQTTFEVYIEWTGPPAHGFPPSDRPVEGSDAYTTPDRTLARAIADQAELAFRRPEVPDLRAIARDLKHRLSRGGYG
jgi:hypothetical protein